MQENEKGSSVENNNNNNNNNNSGQVMKQLKQRLTLEQYHVCISKGTELSFTGKYWDCKEDGLCRCVCCVNDLFDSETKFDSGTGWPSFWALAKMQNLKFVLDKSHGMRRVEVQCNNCEAHLGHVIDDGPPFNRKKILHQFRVART
jgi:peptide-methionine (R)-S-oxide reductase